MHENLSVVAEMHEILSAKDLRDVGAPAKTGANAGVTLASGGGLFDVTAVSGDGPFGAASATWSGLCGATSSGDGGLLGAASATAGSGSLVEHWPQLAVAS